MFEAATAPVMHQELQIAVTVDWEGEHLESANLQSLKSLGELIPGPLVHFLNPGYFTRGDLGSAAWVRERISSALNPGDELGLHLHAPRHLVRRAGVKLRQVPRFASSGSTYCYEEQGQDVMVHSYTQDEVEQLIATGQAIIESEFSAKLTSFRAGGWMAAPHTISALAKRGLTIDSSASPASLLKGTCWEGENLQRYIEILWENIDWTSQPFYFEGTEVLEVPNNLGAVDYWNETAADHLASEVADLAQHRGSHLAVITLHQETAKDCVPLALKTLKKLEELTSKRNISTRYVDLQSMRREQRYQPAESSYKVCRY